MEKLSKLIQWIKTLPLWGKCVALLILLLLAVLMTFTSCAANHQVVQSSYNTATGDSIVIRYEQTGRFKR